MKRFLLLLLLLPIGAMAQGLSGGGGNGVPGGSSGQIQYNNSGAFGGKAIPDTGSNCLGYTGGAFGSVTCSGGGTGNSIVNLTPVTANANSTSEQFLMELSLSAGYLNSLSQPFLIQASGLYTAGAAQTPTIRLRAKLCTVSGCGSGTVVTLFDVTSNAITATASNNGWGISLMTNTAATGASGNLEVHGPMVVDLGSNNVAPDTVFWDTNTTVTSNINLTAALFIDWSVVFSTNGASSNSITQRQGQIAPYAATAAPVTSVTGTSNQITCSPTTGAVVCSSPFSVASGKTFTANNTLTVAGTDSTTITFQATDTYVGRATTDTLTNKTFDTAGTGNVFKINGTQISAKTGTGSAVLSAGPTFTGDAKFAATTGTIIADADASTITFDLSTGNLHSVTLTANRTLALSNDANGKSFTIILVQDNSGSHTVTWFANIKWAGGSVPTLTTTANKADAFTFVEYSAGNYYGVVSGQNF